MGRFARQFAGSGVDGRLHVARRAVDLAVEVELDRDDGAAQRADGGDLGDTGDLGEAPFEWRRQRRSHRLRIRPGSEATRRWSGSRSAGSARPAGSGRRRCPSGTARSASSEVADGTADEWLGDVHERSETHSGSAGGAFLELALAEQAGLGAAAARNHLAHRPCTGRSPASCRGSGTATAAGRRRSRCPLAGAVPSPCRVPSANGSAPSSAAMVVIMIGRNRSRQA